MCRLLVLCLSLPGIFAASAADETLPVLKVGSDVYSNVTVTAVTTTHLSFTHLRGMGSVKLRNLSPELQKQFHFNGSPKKRERLIFRTALSSKNYLLLPTLIRPDSLLQTVAKPLTVINVQSFKTRDVSN